MFKPEWTHFKEDLFRVKGESVPPFQRSPSSGLCPYCGLSLLLAAKTNVEHVFSPTGMFMDEKRQKGNVVTMRACEPCNTAKSELDSCMNAIIHCRLEDDGVDASQEFNRILGLGAKSGATLGSKGLIKNMLQPYDEEVFLAPIGYAIGIHPYLQVAIDQISKLHARSMSMFVSGEYFSESMTRKVYVCNPYFNDMDCLYIPFMHLGEADIGFNVGNNAVIGHLWIREYFILASIRYARQLIAVHVMFRG